MNKNSLILLVFVLLAALVIVYLIYKAPKPNLSPSPTSSPNPISMVNPSPSSGAVLGVQTKTSGCLASGGLQDKACTPGAVIPGVTKDQVCTPGYSKSVRNVSTEEKKQVYEEYGILEHRVGEYEVDHLISLELGGSNDISNLWPEAANPRPGFHEKDFVENSLHEKVCIGAMTLEQAQHDIAQNWLGIYNSISH